MLESVSGKILCGTGADYIMKENKYTISEAARLLSVENHVLRYWEEELELNIPRNELGHRYYREEEIQLLHCIKELKNKGFQLKAVKEVLPDLEQKKLIDIHKLLTTQEELENQELEEERKTQQTLAEEKQNKEYNEKYGEKQSKTYNEKYTEIHNKKYNEKPDKIYNEVKRKNQKGSENDLERSQGSSRIEKEDKSCKVVAIHQNEVAATITHEEKMQQFEEIMGRIVGKALREQAENLGDAMGNHLCNKMLREVDELMVEQEQREEERYKKLDEAIRSTQRARQEIAVSKDGVFKKKSRFFRKNKRKL